MSRRVQETVENKVGKVEVVKVEERGEKLKKTKKEEDNRSKKGSIEMGNL